MGNRVVLFFRVMRPSPFLGPILCFFLGFYVSFLSRSFFRFSRSSVRVAGSACPHANFANPPLHLPTARHYARSTDEEAPAGGSGELRAREPSVTRRHRRTDKRRHRGAPRLQHTSGNPVGPDGFAAIEGAHQARDLEHRGLHGVVPEGTGRRLGWVHARRGKG